MRIARIVWSLLGVAMLAACSHAGGFSALPSAFDPSLLVRPDAGGFKVLYSFKNFPDALEPAAGLVELNGTLYGTAQVGGQADSGAVFKTSTAGKESVLYSFGSNGPDGLLPVAGLTVLNGTFYGTTTSGGDHGFGTVFKIDKAGNEKVIYSFKGSADGVAPYTALTAHKGALYGVTLDGGGSTSCTFGCGTVFEVTTAGKEHVVYAFKGGNDGIGPLGTLVVIGSEFYGTTASGGKNGGGTLFKTSTSGKEQVLHSFGAGLDGGDPDAGVVVLGGKLYGTTNTGGKNGDGTVFDSTTGGNENVIYNFKGGNDGENPEASLIVLNGKLYGTTAGGGSSNSGTVFAVSASGSESVLHAFKSAEGSDPRSPLLAFKGTLYGTTSMGGANGFGTIFKTSP